MGKKQSKQTVENNKEAPVAQDDVFDFDEILRQGQLTNGNARTVGFIFGNEFAATLFDDHQFAFEDLKKTPRLLKSGVIAAIKDSFDCFGENFRSIEEDDQERAEWKSKQAGTNYFNDLKTMMLYLMMKSPSPDPITLWWILSNC